MGLGGSIALSSVRGVTPYILRIPLYLSGHEPPSQAIWAHQFGEPGLFSAPKMPSGFPASLLTRREVIFFDPSIDHRCSSG